VEDRPGGGASFKVYLPGRPDASAQTFEAPEVTESART